MALAKDASVHPRDVADFHQQHVLFDDDFREGLCGWSGLRNSGTNNRFPGLHPYSMTGPQSMILDTEGGASGVTAWAIKRLTLQTDSVRWHSRVGWTSLNANYLRYIDWSIDVEDASYRYWFQVRYRHFDEDGVVISPIWQVQTGTPSGGMTFTTITGLTTELMFNQPNKVNFHNVTIEFDLDTKTYTSLTIDGVTTSLTSMSGPSPDTKLASPDTYFTGGCNPIFSVTNRSNNSSAEPKLFVDRTRFEVL